MVARASSASIELPNGLPFHRFELANGLRVYLVEDHSAPVFTFQIWFDVGSKHEKLDPKLNATGLAHLFEHMMFRGTPRFPDGEFDKILARAGVRDGNATTWLDRTNYYESLPREYLELVLDLESDRMVNLQIDERLLETEKGAVLGEYRMGLDDPDSVAMDHLFNTAYQVHPYRYTTIGTEEEIKSFTKEQSNYFYRKYYAPNNASILITGDVDPAQAQALIEKYFGGFQSQPIEVIPAPVEPPQTSERRFEFSHNQLTDPKLVLGYRIPDVRHEDTPALLVLQSILATGEGALLRKIWANTGLAVSADSDVFQFRDPSLLYISAEVQEGHEPEELLSALDESLKTLTKDTFSKEVERAKNQLLLELYAAFESNASLADFMGEFIPTAGDPLYAFELVQKVEKIRPADVQRAVEQYLKPTNRSVIVGNPSAGE